MDDKDPAVSVCFKVKIDEDSLGVFNSCEGLGCEIVIEQREEGGNNAMVWQLPTRMKYTNVKLTRPIGADSAKLTKWFAGMMNGVKPTTMVISAMTLDETRRRRMVAVRGHPGALDRPEPELRHVEGGHRDARGRAPRHPAARRAGEHDRHPMQGGGGGTLDAAVTDR